MSEMRLGNNYKRGYCPGGGGGRMGQLKFNGASSAGTMADLSCPSPAQRTASFLPAKRDKIL